MRTTVDITIILFVTSNDSDRFRNAFRVCGNRNGRNIGPVLESSAIAIIPIYKYSNFALRLMNKIYLKKITGK